MECDGTRELFLKHDELLSDRKRVLAAVEHLKSCAECQAALADYADLREVLRNPSHVEPVGGWGQFQDRLKSTARHSERVTFIGWRSASAVAASITLLALAIIGSSYLNNRPIPHEGQLMATSGTSRFSPAEVPQQVQAFAKVSEAFDNRASWMLISDHSSDVGVAETAITERSLVLLRLTLLRAQSVVSKADLVLVPGQQADLTLPLSDGKSLHYRISASRTTPTSLSVWLEIENPQAPSETLAALATQLPLAPGQVVSAGQLATTSGAYELKVGFARSSVGSRKSPDPLTPSKRGEVND